MKTQMGVSPPITPATLEEIRIEVLNKLNKVRDKDLREYGKKFTGWSGYSARTFYAIDLAIQKTRKEEEKKYKATFRDFHKGAFNAIVKIRKKVKAQAIREVREWLLNFYAYPEGLGLRSLILKEFDKKFGRTFPEGKERPFLPKQKSGVDKDG